MVHDPAQDTLCLLTRLNVDDDTEAILCTFERVIIPKGWAQQDLSYALVPLLTRECGECG